MSEPSLEDLREEIREMRAAFAATVRAQDVAFGVLARQCARKGVADLREIILTLQTVEAEHRKHNEHHAGLQHYRLMQEKLQGLIDLDHP